MISRRTFVGLVGCLTAAGGLGLGLTMANRRNISLVHLSSQDLKNIEKTNVILRARDGQDFAAVVENIQVVVRPGRRGAPTTEQISLRLKNKSADLPAGVYRLQGAETEIEELLFNAVGQPGHDRHLEAVINRIV